MLVQRIKGYLLLIGWSPWNIKGPAKELYIVIYNYEILMHKSLVPGQLYCQDRALTILKTGAC